MFVKTIGKSDETRYDREEQNIDSLFTNSYKSFLNIEERF